MSCAGGNACVLLSVWYALVDNLAAVDTCVDGRNSVGDSTTSATMVGTREVCTNFVLQPASRKVSAVGYC